MTNRTSEVEGFAEPVINHGLSAVVTGLVLDELQEERGRKRTVGTLHGVKQWGETPGTRTSRLCPNSLVGTVLSWERRGSKARKQSPFKSDDINILAQKQAPWLLKIKNKN